MPFREPGRVVKFETGLRWRVLFSDVEHEAASSYLRELAASDCSPSTLRSYGFDLLWWFRFLDRRWTAWERAERIDVRQFVEWLAWQVLDDRGFRGLPIERFLHDTYTRRGSTEQALALTLVRGAGTHSRSAGK
jgi:hypothetical protein